MRAADHPERGPAQGQPGDVEEERGCRARPDSHGQEGGGVASHAERHADEGRTRYLVAGPDQRREYRSEDLSLRGDGRGGPALPALHEWDDRETEGYHPHDCRVPGWHRDDPPLHLRHPAQLDLLVRCRYRLGDWA